MCLRTCSFMYDSIFNNGIQDGHYYNRKFTKLMQKDQTIEIRSLLMQLQTEEVSSAENKLAAYAKYPGFLQAIIQIIRESSDQQWLKTVAASFLNSALLGFPQEQQSQVSEVLKQVLYDPAIKQLDKRCFEKSIIKMIGHGRQQLHRQWQKIIGDFLKVKPNFDSAYLVLACFAAADEVPYSILRGIIQNNFQPILSSLQVGIQNANLLNEMVKMWIVIFDSLRMNEENNQTLYYMANSQKLLDLIDMLYQFQALDNVIITLNPNLYELNLLKYEAAQLNKRLLIFANESPIKCRVLQEYLKKNFKKFARTLHIMSLQKQTFETIGCQDLLTTLLSLQQLYLALSPQEFNYQTAISLIENQIFPYLPINDEERQKFEQSPQEFNSLAEDCCDKQTYGILKTQALKLLQTIGDKVQGCFKYIFRRAIQSIKVGLGFVSVYTEQAALLPVQTAFLILSVFSYGIGHYQQQLSSIKVIFCDDRIKSLPPLQISRVFTFLAYNYNQVYSSPQEGENWIGFALAYNVHPTTSYCAYDFLSNVVDQHFCEAFLEALVNQIALNKRPLIWQITTKIIQNHFSRLSAQGIILIIVKLFERIRSQIILIESHDKKDTLDLGNCIAQFSVILLALKEDQNQVAEQSSKYQQILSSIWPIVKLYQPFLQWNLQDQIVKAVINIINVIPSIVPDLHPLVPQFITLFKTNGYFEKIYLRFFNQFALKADFIHDQQSLIQILVVLKDALLNSVMKVSIAENGKYKGSQGERVTVGNILLILQNVLAIHGNNLFQSNSLEFFNEIGSLCLRLLPNVDQQAQRTSSGRIIMSRTLNTLFLCHMHSKTDCFYNYLSRLRGQNLYHGHDTRVFLLCVVKQVFRQTDFSALTSLIEALMQIIGKSSEKDEVLEKRKKGKSKQQQKTARISSHLKKIGDMDKILKSIDSPFFKDGSIGEEIINLFTTMNSGNSDMVNHIVKSLTPESFVILKKYVDLDNLGKKKRVIRKVVGIKEGPSEIDVQLDTRLNKNKAMQQEEDGDSEEDVGPKRQRTKIKIQGKKKSTARRLGPSQYN